MQTIITITHNDAQADAVARIHAETGNKMSAGLKLQNAIRQWVSGARQAKIKVGVNAAKASATLTGTSVVATDAVSINGVAFTAVASGATGNQFNIGASDTETMANLAAAINASSDMTDIVTAESNSTVCTVTAASAGKLGNCITLTSADATIVASAARLAGGDNGAAEKTHYYGSAT